MNGRNMRFKRWPHRTQFEDTPRKRAALSRSQRKHRERFPLLAEIIAEVQPDADTVMNDRAYQWRRDEDNARQQRAEEWRRARERIAAYDSTLRHQVLNLWRTAPTRPTRAIFSTFSEHSKTEESIPPVLLGSIEVPL
jgi:hypothetical protein